jgi:LysR family nitrogen assimilation transcriptional regulator
MLAPPEDGGKPIGTTIRCSRKEKLMQGRPDLEDLNLFICVANTGSLSQAAWLTGKTPSALSKRITALELGMGHRLFTRNGRGVVLTDAGQALIGPARRLLEDAALLKSQVDDGAKSPSGTVVLGLQASISWPLMQMLWRRTQTEAPAIRLRVHEASTRQLVEELLQSRIDLGVLSDWGPERLKDAVLLHEAPLMLVGSASDALTGVGSIPFARLAGLPLILSWMPNGTRAWLETAARDAGLSLDVVIEGHSMHLIRKMVQAGWGYTVAHRHAIQDELEAGALSASEIVEPRLVQKFYLARASDRPPSTASERVSQWITQWRETDGKCAVR